MTAGVDWRSRKKTTSRRTIQQHALRLFTANGYEATTVEQIAAAAGVSHMTFYRYFPRKEAVVESDDYDPLLERLISARPADEPPLMALHAAMRAALETILATDRETVLTRVRLIMATPALRARLWIAHDSTRDLFARALARRAGVTEPDLAGIVQAGAALAANGAALQAWAEHEDADLLDLVDAAFAALTPHGAGPVNVSPAPSAPGRRSGRR